MKIIINEKQYKLLAETDWNFHYGKEHNGEPYRSETKYMCYHETGQFGSGTYFSTYNSAYEKTDALEKYGNEDVNSDHNFINIKGGLYRVDFDLYKNLYRVWSEKEGDILHTMLSRLNGFYHKVSGFGLGDYHPKQAEFDNSRIYLIIAMNAKVLGLKCPSYLELTRMAQEHAKKGKEAPQSFSTVFMEYNGFNGVNVSGIDKFDNSRHGSVIYDLSKVSSEIVPIEKKNVFLSSIAGSNHTDSVAYTYDRDGKESALANSLVGKFQGFAMNNLSSKEKMRIVKNIIDSGKNFDFDMLEYKFRNEPRIMNYIIKSMLKHKVSDDVVYDYNTVEYIVKNKLYDFINYKPRYYEYSKCSFFTRFLDEYYWDINDEDLSDEEKRKKKEEFLQFLMNKLTRELTKSEKEYIKEYFDETE